jgi:hypothetical protein
MSFVHCLLNVFSSLLKSHFQSIVYKNIGLLMQVIDQFGFLRIKMNMGQAQKHAASDICDSSNVSPGSLRTFNGSIRVNCRTSIISIREGKCPKLYATDEISKWLISVDVRLEFGPNGDASEMRVKIFPYNGMETIGELSFDEFFNMVPEFAGFPMDLMDADVGRFVAH